MVKIKFLNEEWGHLCSNNICYETTISLNDSILTICDIHCFIRLFCPARCLKIDVKSEIKFSNKGEIKLTRGTISFVIFCPFLILWKRVNDHLPLFKDMFYDIRLLHIISKDIATQNIKNIFKELLYYKIPSCCVAVF